MSYRATSRVLVFDGTGRTLLFLQYGKSRNVPPRWITPGGGVDPGETHDQAAVRELFEETGLRLESVGAAFRDEDFVPDQRWHPYQTGHWAWYAVRMTRFEPSRDGWTEEEVADVIDWRWMTAEELEADENEFEPPELADLIRERGHP